MKRLVARLVCFMLLFSGFAQATSIGTPYVNNNSLANWIGMAELNGKIYLAWHDLNATVVHLMYSTDGGTSFQGDAKTQTDGYVGSSVAAYNGQLYLAFRGLNANHDLNVIPITIGANGAPTGADYGRKWTSAQSSDEAPWLYVANQSLFIAWLGKGNHHVCVAKLNVP